MNFKKKKVKIFSISIVVILILSSFGVAFQFFLSQDVDEQRQYNNWNTDLPEYLNTCLVPDQIQSHYLMSFIVLVDYDGNGNFTEFMLPTKIGMIGESCSRPVFSHPEKEGGFIHIAYHYYRRTNVQDIFFVLNETHGELFSVDGEVFMGKYRYDSSSFNNVDVGIKQLLGTDVWSADQVIVKYTL